VAHALLSQSPRHAWWQHPTLNPEYVEEESEAMDIGTAAHAYLLQGETGFTIVDLPDWRTKIARDTRDAARAAGKTPLLAHRWASVQAMAAAARAQFAHVEPPIPFTDDTAEQSIFWTEQGVECRATPDWLSHDHLTIDELKTVGGSGHPSAFSRALWEKGYGMQCALYRRAVKRVHGKDAEFRWIVCETEPPYAVSLVALDPEATEFADLQLDEALRIWKRCLGTGEWPCYPTRVAYAEVPRYLLTQWADGAYYQEASRRQ